VVILDEPTRGVDVGAHLAIYEIVAELAGPGMAAIVVSSDLDEGLGLAPPCDGFEPRSQSRDSRPGHCRAGVGHGARHHLTNTTGDAKMRMFSLKDQIAFVTGAGSGIGQGIPIGLAEAGADVALFDLPGSRGLEDTTRAIAEKGCRTVHSAGCIDAPTSSAASVCGRWHALCEAA